MLRRVVAVLVGVAAGALAVATVAPGPTDGSVAPDGGGSVVSDGGPDDRTMAGDAGAALPETGTADPGAAEASPGPVAASPAGPGDGSPPSGADEPASTPPTKVRIGLAAIDVGALRALGPAFDVGDRRQHVAAMVAGWREEGLIPVAGRDVEFVVREYGVLDPAAKRAACVGLVRDDRVFAVVADARFADGVQCVAREHRTPLITGESQAEEVFDATAPYFFSMQMSLDRLFRNWIRWAHARGLLDDARVGIYYTDDPQEQRLVERVIKRELVALGHPVVAEATTNNELGGPEDALAVQRFQSTRVNVALLLRSKAGFMQQAQARGYRPRYLETDAGFGTSDATTSTYPDAQWDGTFAMTGLRYGEAASGIGPTAEAAWCVNNYERRTGDRIDPVVENGAWTSVVGTCDIGRVILHALRHAGPRLTKETFVAAIETVRRLPMGLYPDVSVHAGRRSGVDSQRTLRWGRSCRCWRVVTPFAPLYAP